MKKISLVQLKENRKAKVAEVHTGALTEHRLLSMGIYKGREITKISQFALKGAVAVKVGRAVLALGRGMASKIMVEVE